MKPPTFVRDGHPGDQPQPFAIETFNVAKRARLIAEGVSPADALEAARVGPGKGRVIVSVEALNEILKHSRLPATRLVELLAK